jgi:hypothetical protein
MRTLTLYAMLFAAFPAEAHIELRFPVPRTLEQKSGPCGGDGARDPNRVTVFPPGATVDVRWAETIDHPGHFRVSFDDDGEDDFYLPSAFDDFPGDEPTILVDNIVDEQLGGERTQRITLPDAECDNCTLQVIQMMTDKAPYGDGNDIYFQCADLEVREGADPAGEPPPGCACVSSRASRPWLASGALVLTGLLWRSGSRRRTRPRASP